MDRKDAVDALTADGKRTSEQANAFLDVLGSAFRRRGWAEGEPLTQDQIAERVDTFIGCNERGHALCEWGDGVLHHHPSHGPLCGDDTCTTCEYR